MAKLIVGCGYLGQRVADRWIRGGHAVYVVTRDPSRAQDLAARGFHPLLGDVTEPIAMPELSSLETVLYAVGFDRDSGKSMREVYVAGLHRVLQNVPAVGKFIYVSSTGVYGSTDGDWVDEETPARPTREGGQICLEAEQLLQDHPVGKRSVILRLAGIYGPGRLPKLQDVKAGRPLKTAPDNLLNLIHVEDAASAVEAAERRAEPPRLFTVSDGCPVLRRDFYTLLAEKWDAPAPVFAEDGDSGRGAGSKRISNRRIVEELRLELRYPDYRAGLASCLEEQN